jgi:heparan-alpha-glucosaminide N-acetyltransferase
MSFCFRFCGSLLGADSKGLVVHPYTSSLGRFCPRIIPGMNSRDAASANAGHATVDITGRIASIDIFRGLTVLVMVFVDNLDFVKGLPWWTYHMPRQANGLTYVDMVFPAFLFVMGMSIPLAVERRIAAGDADSQIWLYIVARSLSLVALGLFIANGPQVDPQRTGISVVSWDLLGFAGIALFWGVPSISPPDKRLSRILKYSGLLVLMVLALMFRRTTAEGHAAWLDFSDWEILGLLGWAYLLAGSLYLLFRKKVLILAVSLMSLIALNVVSSMGVLKEIHHLPPLLQPFEAGLSSITVAGLLISLIFVEGTLARTFRTKVLGALSYAAVLAAAGWVLMPLGISKLRDTPAWCMYCSAANILLFLFLYWMVDVRQWKRYVAFIEPVGSNALLAYLLAYVAYFVPKLSRLTADGTEGWYGVVRSLLFVALIVAVVSALTRMKFRLRV